MKKKTRLLALVCAGMIISGAVTGCGEDKNKANDEEAYRTYGINCMQSGDYEGALAAFQKALDHSSKGITNLEIDICYYKAETQFLMGQPEAAIDTYSSIIAYKEYAKAYYLRACAYYKIGETDKAKADMDKASELADKDYELYIAMYETMAENGMADSASENLTKALDIKGDKPYDHLQKGRVYALLGEQDKAIENLEKAIDGEESKANYYIAGLYKELGDDEKAMYYYSEYISKGEATPEELCDIGESQLESGDYKTAIEYFDAIMKMNNPSNMQQAMKDSIIAYEQMGDFKKASKLIKEYTKKYPEDDDAIKEASFLGTRE